MEWNRKRVKKLLSNENTIIMITTKVEFVEPDLISGAYKPVTSDQMFQRRLLTNMMLLAAKNKRAIWKWEFESMGTEFYQILEDVNGT